VACVRREWVKLYHFVCVKFTSWVSHGTVFHHNNGCNESVSVVVQVHDYCAMFELLLEGSQVFRSQCLGIHRLQKSRFRTFSEGTKCRKRDPRL